MLSVAALCISVGTHIRLPDRQMSRASNKSANSWTNSWTANSWTVTVAVQHPRLVLGALLAIATIVISLVSFESDYVSRVICWVSNNSDRHCEPVADAVLESAGSKASTPANEQPSESAVNDDQSVADLTRDSGSVAGTVIDSPTKAPRALYDREYVLVEPSEVEVAELQQRLQNLTQSNKLKQQDFELRLEVAPQEAAAVRRAELMAAVELWRSAWQAGNIQVYLNSYHTSFKESPSYSAWLAKRQKQISSAEQVSIELSDFRVLCTAPGELNASRCTIEFNQTYQSSNYKDLVRKALTMALENTRYKIESEYIVQQF